MKEREFLCFQWYVIDKCNLPCVYCINKAGYNKVRERKTYVSGIEIKVAEKIVKLSQYADKVTVNLTGGEPLLAERIIDTISILTRIPNVTIQLITNLKLINTFKEKAPHLLPLLKIAGSLHISYRSDKEVDRLIDFINQNRSQLDIFLTQVDYNLSPDDKNKLSRIEKETGLNIWLQTPISVPFNPEKKEFDNKKSSSDEEEDDKNFNSTKGKRCCVGYSQLYIQSDGTLWYDLWCLKNTRKTVNFLDIDSSKLADYLLDEMKKCERKGCPCNYNTFYYEEYLSACKRLGYSPDEIFEPVSENKEQQHKEQKQSYHQRIQTKLSSMNLFLKTRSSNIKNKSKAIIREFKQNFHP